MGGHGPVHPAFDEERRRWQDPEAILYDIGLRPGLTFMDIGCGGGFFTLPAARIAGQQGKVYGLDISGEAIRKLGETAAAEGLQNLELAVGEAEEIVLCEGCGDIVFFGTVLHDFQDAARVLKNARRMVKPGGKLVNLDWKKEPTEIGPPPGKRFSAEYATGLITAAGFRVVDRKDAGAHHYVITALLPPEAPEKAESNRTAGFA